MEESCGIELANNYLESQNDEEICMSDDSEVSVANMNRKSDNDVSKRETDGEQSQVIDDDVDNEIVSDEEYSYSEDSEFSDHDSTRESEMTNVTPRSSMSAGSPMNRTINLDYPISHLAQITQISDYSHRRTNDSPENLRRMCSSVIDNRFSIEPANSRPGRINMSFTNDQMRQIDFENQYLLKKIMAQQKPQNKPMRSQSAQPRVSSSAINRRKFQKRIEAENMMLLRRIQDTKSCAVSSKIIPGYRLTSL